VIVTPGAASKYDGSAAIREGRVTRVDLSGLGYPAMQGIAFNPSNNHIYLSDPIGRKVYEITKNGQEQSTFDLSSLNLVNPQTLLFAPSGDQTDNPNKQSLFILDGTPATVSTTPEKLSGVKFASPLFAAASSGSIIELSLAARITAWNDPVAYHLVHVIDTSRPVWGDPSSPDTSGVDYWPLIGGLLISDSEVDEMTVFPPFYQNVFFSTFSGHDLVLAVYTSRRGIQMSPRCRHQPLTTASTLRMMTPTKLMRSAWGWMGYIVRQTML
jgi:hypothetical protein